MCDFRDSAGDNGDDIDNGANDGSCSDNDGAAAAVAAAVTAAVAAAVAANAALDDNGAETCAGGDKEVTIVIEAGRSCCEGGSAT